MEYIIVSPYGNPLATSYDIEIASNIADMIAGKRQEDLHVEDSTGRVVYETCLALIPC